MQDTAEYKHTLLVVEDNVVNREILCNILEESFNIITASNGLDGLNFMREHYKEISVVILDINMPVMNGYEFIEAVKDDIRLSKIPIVVTTVHSSINEEIHCLDMGVFDFIAKPYIPKLILTRINNIIRLLESEKSVVDSTTDALTGVKNRKGYYEDVESFAALPDASSRTVGIVYMDINGLKEVNDEEDHTAGDLLIKNVVETAKQVFYDAEIYRMGGDEFIILSFDESESSLGKKVMKLKTCWTENVSASLGMVFTKGMENIEAGVAAADRNMYEEKTKYYEERADHNKFFRKILNSDMLRLAGAMTEFLPGGFLAFRLDTGELIHYNKDIVNMLGYKSSKEMRQMVNNNIKNVVHPDDYNLLRAGVNVVKHRASGINTVELRLTMKNGNLRLITMGIKAVNTVTFGEMAYVFIIMDRY
ncbi:MAG: response regulator [Anaerovibrio sp.]|uniref:response regulator n=1 Tax=Anaerovibrio sp. TaxID=1872532 RepID=UPI001B29387A|nr:response regulator [Anaerovibrio sp.]MBO5589220.1 response regulator [Anaerovibrio sp.]MBO6245371.1 response regulator [Anaerovibrio sp.]MBP3231789.1 response regulator [Anaerovibrio sp.]